MCNLRGGGDTVFRGGPVDVPVSKSVSLQLPTYILLYVIGQQIRPITRILRQPKRGQGHATQKKLDFLKLRQAISSILRSVPT